MLAPFRREGKGAFKGRLIFPRAQSYQESETGFGKKRLYNSKIIQNKLGILEYLNCDFFSPIILLKGIFYVFKYCSKFKKILNCLIYSTNTD